jgi:predicted transcriptional regulator
MPATAHANEMEGRVLTIVEESEGPISVDQLRAEMAEDRGELGEAIRSLVSKGCILVTRDWELVSHPGHEQLH